MIPRIDTTTEEDNAYWQAKASRPALPRLGKPCHDCAVTCGFYGEIVANLEEQPREIQECACRSWFCHNEVGHSCRGAIDHFKVEP